MKALIVALDSSGAAAELWDPIVRAASHKALWRERLVALDSSGAAEGLAVCCVGVSVALSCFAVLCEWSVGGKA